MANVTIVNQPAQVQTVTSGGQQTQNTGDAGRQTTTLAQGSVISGTIIGKDSNGNYVLRTASDGNVSLHSATPLTYNSDVEVRIGANSAGGTTARILTVNGQPFEGTEAQAQPEGDSVSDSLLAQTAQSPTAASALPAFTATQTVRAVVVPSPAAPAAPADSAGSSAATPQTAQAQEAGTINTGDNVILHVQAQQTPAAIAAQPTGPSAQPVTTSEQAISNPLPVPASQQQTTPTAQQTVAVAQNAVTTAGTELSGALVVSQPGEPGAVGAESPATQAATTPGNAAEAAVADSGADTTTTASQPPQPATTASYAAYAKQPLTAAPAQNTGTSGTVQLLPAQITSANEDGTVTLQTPNGTFTVQPEALPAGASLIPGTNLQVELTATALAFTGGTAQLVSSAPAPLSELALSWDTLKDIVSATGGSDPASPSAAGATVSGQMNPALANLPQLSENFAASSVAFISAVAEGNVRKLLGDDVIESLKQSGRGDLIEKFSGEVDSLSQSMTQAAARPTPGWQMIFMPFVYQEAIQQARLYIKREPPKKEKPGDASGGDTRFVVEVDLTEMGPIQMDGLVRKQEKNTAFDLIVRSHTAFTGVQRAEISAIYSEAAALTGFKGGLSFQVTHDFPVKPLDEMPAQSARDILA